MSQSNYDDEETVSPPAPYELRNPPFNQFLVVVGYNRALPKYGDRKQFPMGDPDRNMLFGRVSADMGMNPPEPELTQDEMQSVAFAAKMALAKVMVKRLKKQRDELRATARAVERGKAHFKRKRSKR